MSFETGPILRREVLRAGAIAAAGAWSGFPQFATAADEARATPGFALKCMEPDAERGASKAVVVGDVALAHTEQVFTDTTDGAACLKSLITQLDERIAIVGASSADVVRYHFYVADEGIVAAIEKALAAHYSDDYRPTATFVTGQLAQPGARAAVDCVAAVRSNSPETKSLRRAGVAVLPPGGRLYISGDAKPAESSSGSAALRSATTATLKSLENTLRFAGLDRSHVVHVKSFVTPIGEVESARAAIVEFFGDEPPPMSFVEWHSKSLPIEIELIAAVPANRVSAAKSRVEYLTPPGMTASPVFSRAARVSKGPLIYTSGIYGDPALDTPGRIRSILGEVRRLVTLGGGSMTNLVKATYYVSDDESSIELGKIRPEFYQPDSPPAASKAATTGVGRQGHQIVVDMIAAAEQS
jgi:enamine deaminase RidA (YjgF/YER057c/UK114 family)